MPTTYSPSLRLSDIGDGEQAGTWGATTDTNICTLLESAIAGRSSFAVTTADVTLTASNGADDQSRHAVLEMTGTSTAARNVIVPAAEKLWLAYNNTSGGYAHTVKTSAGTGISVPNGKKMFLFCDGTNVVEALTQISTLLPLAGGTMTGAILASDGLVGTPSISFSSDSDTGLYWNSTGVFSVTSNGAAVVTFGTTTTLSGLAVSGGASTFSGAVINNSTLAQVGASTFTGAATFNGAVTLGDTSGDTITVNGTTTFAGPVSFTGVPTFYGNVTIGDTSGDTLTVVSTATFSNATTFSSTTAHTGASTFASTVAFNGAVTNNSTLAQVGASTFTGTLTSNGTTTLNGAVNLGDATGDAVTVTGNTTVGASTTLTKASAGSFISHGSSGHTSGVITVSASSPSGGSNGDIWFQI